MSFDDFSLEALCQELTRQRAPARSLHTLETRVWFAIAEERETWPRRVEACIAGLLVPQYRLASMGMAAMVGLLFALLGSSPISAAPQLSDLRVFAVNYGINLSPIAHSRQGDGI